MASSPAKRGRIEEGVLRQFPGSPKAEAGWPRPEAGGRRDFRTGRNLPAGSRRIRPGADSGSRPATVVGGPPAAEPGRPFLSAASRRRLPAALSGSRLPRSVGWQPAAFPGRPAARFRGPQLPAGSRTWKSGGDSRTRAAATLCETTSRGVRQPQAAVEGPTAPLAGAIVP